MTIWSYDCHVSLLPVIQTLYMGQMVDARYVRKGSEINNLDLLPDSKHKSRVPIFTVAFFPISFTLPI